ncbi:hypothetical protein HPP92_019213 [Vanilla planifolia]|uniref:PRONE domain-containing protein n=1 Tax=Vanilla planifolia TaxID=51239 RepID=A0A835UN48_VANPL|nr:hypothetical protein HPP92_019213 [Vanilla planifolia]
MKRPLFCKADEPVKNGCLPLVTGSGVSNLNTFPFSVCEYLNLEVLHVFWLGFACRGQFRSRRTQLFLEGVIFLAQDGELGMDGLADNSGLRNTSDEKNDCASESCNESAEECRKSHSSSEVSSCSSSSSDDGRVRRHSVSDKSSKEKASKHICWPMHDDSVSSSVGEEQVNQDEENADLPKHIISEMEMMKERFAKLLLGEDMSGCGKGVCTAMAISNAITNLCATLFGQLWRLEPLSAEKKSMWRREMEWLLCVSDQIVEFRPSWQTFHDGSKVEVMTCRPRSDIYINLPALRKLDNMLIEVLDSFKDPEFWYVDKAILAPDSDCSASFRKTIPNQEKWWLPSPRVPCGGLSEKTRKQLEHKRDSTSQILKAAMSINSNTLSEMEVPDSFIDSLPKNGRTSLGDVIYRYITSEKFSPEHLLDCLDLSSEYQAVDMANRVEAASYIWRRRTAARTPHSSTRSSWGMVREIMMVDKRELLASRAESLLICLKQRFPGLTQTILDMSKIQFNKDVGKSILEAYSRVLESLAFNIIARIEDLFFVDDLAKNANQFSPVPTVEVVSQKGVSIPCLVPVLGTPYRSSHAPIRLSPAAPLHCSTKGGKGPPSSTKKLQSRGFGVKKVLTDYLGVEPKEKGDMDMPPAPPKNLNQ